MKTTPEQYFTELRRKTLSLRSSTPEKTARPLLFCVSFKNCTSVQDNRLNCILPFVSKHLRVVLILNCGQVNHIIYSSKFSPSLSITVLCKGAKRSVSHLMFTFTSKPRILTVKDSSTQLHCTTRGKSLGKIHRHAVLAMY